ncbi:hypothetical protein L9F63_022982, partial [Diploptera punctata]
HKVYQVSKPNIGELNSSTLSVFSLHQTLLDDVLFSFTFASEILCAKENSTLV